MNNLIFSVEPKVIDLGIKIQTIRIMGIVNSKINIEFDKFKAEELEKIKELWKEKNLLEDPILLGFRNLHAKIGRSNRKYISSPESLIWLLKKRGKFPQINTLVDIYNLVSVKYILALGAHDVDKIDGNVTLKITDGSEKFTPLGSRPEVIFPGEYAYTDDSNDVICRMEVIQCEKTKITPESKNIFFIIQGNENTKNEYIEAATKELIELVKRFCGGEVTYLNKLS